MSRPIVFVADASRYLGAGHVMRCLTLAGAMHEREADVVLASRELPATMRRRADTVGIRCIDRHSAIDEVGLAEELAAIGPRILIFDSYETDAAAFREIAHAGIRSAVIVDDDAPTPDDPVFVLNHNLHADPESYADLPQETLRMIGPSWALIRSEIRQLRRRRPSRTRRSVLLAFGGTDPLGLTARLGPSLDAVGLVTFRASRLLDGPSTVSEPGKFAEVLATSSVAIVGAGGTVWESLCLGTPTIAIVTADNQEKVAAACEQRGLVRAFDARWGLPVDRVVNATLDLMDEPEATRPMVESGRRLIDGRGAERAAESILSTLKHLEGRGEL